MADDKIEGISDYCDRWCERCSLSHRCKDFANDLSSSEWKSEMLLASSSNRSESSAQGYTRVQLHGGDVYTLLAKEKYKQKLLSNEPILELSARYAELTSGWLKSQPGMLDRLEKLKEALTLGFASVEVGKSTADAIKNALATIHWDGSFIHSRLIDALCHQIQERSDFVFSGDVKAEGMIKSVLISIDRSLQAWQLVFELLPEREDDFLTLLSVLQKLQRTVSEAFPAAMSFRRPGFDD